MPWETNRKASVKVVEHQTARVFGKLFLGLHRRAQFCGGMERKLLYWESWFLATIFGYEVRCCGVPITRFSLYMQFFRNIIFMFPCSSFLANYCECTLHILSLHNLQNYSLHSLACAQKGNSEQQFNPCKTTFSKIFSTIWILPESDCTQWHRLATLWQATLTF